MNLQAVIHFFRVSFAASLATDIQNGRCKLLLKP